MPRTLPLDLRTAVPSGVATARQLVALGIPERTAYRRCLDGGPWRRVLPGVIFLCTGTPTRDQLVRAALLLAGDDALVTGLEACRRHGIRRGPAAEPGRGHGPAEVHVLVPATRQVRSVGYVHVERTVRLPPPVRRLGIPLVPVARACLDATRRMAAAGDVTELLADAVQRGLCTPADLHRELARCTRRGTAVPRRVLADLDDGVRSAAERAAKHLWAETGLPEPMWNVPVHDAHGRFLGVADCWLDDVAMVWEIESTQWHLSPDAHDRTVARAARFTASGAVYLASKPKTVLTEPATVVGLLRDVYMHAARRPRPPLRATPREG